jgi:hypothetical protein
MCSDRRKPRLPSEFRYTLEELTLQCSSYKAIQKFETSWSWPRWSWRGWPIAFLRTDLKIYFFTYSPGTWCVSCDITCVICVIRFSSAHRNVICRIRHYVWLKYFETHTLFWNHPLNYITNSIEQIPSSEASSPQLLCNPKVHYHVHKDLPLVTILGHKHPLHTLPRYFPKIHSNIIFPSTTRSSKSNTKQFVLLRHKKVCIKTITYDVDPTWIVQH